MNSEIIVHIAGYAFMEIMALYLLYDLFSYEFEFRFKKAGYYVLLCIPLVIVNTLVAICFGTEWRTLTSPAMIVVIMAVFFLGTMSTKVILAIIYFILRSVAEGISALPFSLFGHKNNEQLDLLSWILIIIFAQTLFFILIKIVKIFWGRKKMRVLDWRLAFIALLPVSTMLLIWDIEVRNMKGNYEGSFQLQLAIVLLLISNFAIAAVVERMTLLMQEHRDYELLQMHDEMEKRYYDTIEEMNHKQTIYRHDIKHCLQTLSVLAAQSKVDQMQVVLQEMLEGIEALTPKVYTNSSIFNAMISEKESAAAKAGILFRIEVEPSLDLTFIKETDMICMFGNLLDNAIRGTKQCLKQKDAPAAYREVTVRLFETEGNFILFDVQNHFFGTLNVEKGEFLTTKIIKEGHGLGLKSVKNMAETYGGVLTIGVADGVFTSTLTLSRHQTVQKE